MTENEALEERIDGIEMHLAHQDGMIEDLHETISRQWKLIDELTRKLERVTRQLRDVEGNAGAAPVDRPPPHY